LGAAPFAAALATAAPIIAKVKMLLSAAMPAIKAIAGRMKAAKEGAPPPPPPPPQQTETLQPQEESVQGLGEVEFHGADNVAANELFGMMDEIKGDLGKFSFKNILQKAAALIAPKPKPYNYPQRFSNPPANQQPNFNAQAPLTVRFPDGTPSSQMIPPGYTGGGGITRQPDGSMLATFQNPDRLPPSYVQQYAPQQSYTPPPQQPSGFEKVVNVANALAPNNPVVQTAAALLQAKQNVNNPPSAAADGYQNAGEQAAAQEMQRQGGDGAPAPGDTNVISPAGGAAEPKKDNTLLYVGVGALALGGLYFATR